jgi:hypothetical protein
MDIKAIISQVEQYAPAVLDFLDTNGPKIEAHLPQILAAAKAANGVLKQLKTSGHPTATMGAVLTFITTLVTTAPDLAALLEPLIMAQVQANAEAAIGLQQSAG